jgi:hypothetical protein
MVRTILHLAAALAVASIWIRGQTPEPIFTSRQFPLTLAQGV